jgi:hypothetical protein
MSGEGNNAEFSPNKESKEKHFRSFNSMLQKAILDAN